MELKIRIEKTGYYFRSDAPFVVIELYGDMELVDEIKKAMEKLVEEKEDWKIY